MEAIKTYINGKIYTADKIKPWAEAFITMGDHFLAVGSNDEIKALHFKNSELIDLKGKLVMPGFIDSHAHIILGGFFLLNVDLTKCRSKLEFIEGIKKYANEHQTKWITGGNWNHQNWDEKVLPSKEWIDSFTEDTPVFLNRMDYHMGLANSTALKLAGITKDTQSPEGGLIAKDSLTGEPTGILKDSAMDLVSAVIPENTFFEYENALNAALSEAKRFGITSIHDITYKNHLRVFQKFEREKKLTARIYSIQPIKLFNDLINSEIENGLGSTTLKIGALKAFADGSLGSNTALFKEPYEDDPSTKGLPMDILSSGMLREIAIEADKNNLQLAVHAIGDLANSQVLDIYEEVTRVNPKKDRRFRLEHAQHMLPEDFQRCADLGVIVSAQPYHLYDDGAWAETKIGAERLKYSYAFRKFLDHNVRLAFGSDWSVVSLDPILGIHAAVNRFTAYGKYKNGLIPEEKITVKEAVDAYTSEAAFASFEENIKGSITPGKLADFVILSENIFEIPSEKIENVRIEQTYFNGNLIYKL